MNISLLEPSLSNSLHKYILSSIFTAAHRLYKYSLFNNKAWSSNSKVFVSLKTATQQDFKQQIYIYL